MKNLTKKQKRRIKNIVRKIAGFLVIQLIIILLFLFSYNISKPFDADELTKIYINVDSTDLYTVRMYHSVFVINSNSNKYHFSSPGSNEPTNYELQDKISPGDALAVTYYKFGGNLWVVDARSDTEIYRSIDVQNNEQQDILKSTYIFFFMMEFVYLVVLIIYIRLSTSPIKYHRHNKTIRRKEKHKKNKTGNNTGDG